MYVLVISSWKQITNASVIVPYVIFKSDLLTTTALNSQKVKYGGGSLLVIEPTTIFEDVKV